MGIIIQWIIVEVKKINKGEGTGWRRIWKLCHMRNDHKDQKCFITISSGERHFWTILLWVTLEVGTKPAGRFNFRAMKGFLITQSVKIWDALLCRAVQRGGRDCMTTLPGRFWRGSTLKVRVRTVTGETEALMKSKINFFCLWDSISLDVWAGGDGLGEVISRKRV